MWHEPPYDNKFQKFRPLKVFGLISLEHAMCWGMHMGDFLLVIKCFDLGHEKMVVVCFSCGWEYATQLYHSMIN